MYHFDWVLFWKYLWPVTAFQNPLIRNGLIVTLVVSVIAQAMGVILGLLPRWPKCKNRPSALAATSVYLVFRGTPLWSRWPCSYYGLGVTHIFDFPDWHIGMVTITGAIQAGVLALGINEGAYMAEIVRAGIEAIDVGQMEAAKSLGMTFGLAMRRIILPQAAKVIIPPLGNEFNNMMKTTTLMTIISAGEFFYAFEQVDASFFKPFELYLDASIYYLAMTTVWSLFQSRIESSLVNARSS